MFDSIENLRIVSVLQRENVPFVKVEKRKTHSFFIRTSGSVCYDLCGKELISNEGALVFMPKGSSYEVKRLTEHSRYTAIHFEGDFATQPKPSLYSMENFPEIDQLASNASDLWNFGTSAEKYLCLSLFYRLLSHLSAQESARNDQNKFKTIAPAVAYLKEHIYDASLRVDRLCQLCGISSTYFRQIFAARFDTTPASYILSKRLSHARSIIISRDFTAIADVARSVGFSDPLYFSKAYKKAYGTSPTEDGKD